LEREELMRHFPTDLSQEMKDFATNVAMLSSRYIFTLRSGSKQFGYCTHCRTEFPTKHFTHNSRQECPNCKSVCTVKASGRGHTKLIDEATFTYYEKSTIDPAAIVARTIFAVRNYSEKYWNIDTEYAVKAFYLFAPGGAAMAKRYVGVGYGNKLQVCSLEMCKTIYSVFPEIYSQTKIPSTCSLDSIAEAVTGTSFQYSPWEMFARRTDDNVKFFSLAVKYPRIEYLAKCGFGDLISGKLSGGKTHGAINWRGETIQKILKLNKRDIREIRKSGVIKRVNIFEHGIFFKLFQLSRAENSNLSPEEIFDITDKYGVHFEELKYVMKYATLRKIATYLDRQLKKNQQESRDFITPRFAIHDYRDYIGDCEDLEMDLTNERVLFPADLSTAHRNTSKQRKLVADEITNRKITARLISLQRYCFASGDILIRPAASCQELINEGKKLEHCVGTYADRYAKGETDILLLRNVEAPDLPFYTMEVKKGSIVQCRGKRNQQPTKDVAKFIEQFTNAKLSKQPDRAKVPA